MRKVISFCLFGSDPIYVQGALRNAELVPEIYPGWTARFYMGSGFPLGTAEELHRRGAEAIPCQGNPMLARFMVNDDPGVERFLVRDTDSRLNLREHAAVQAWISSDKPFHVIRDHPGHRVAMPGGLWGGKARIVGMQKLLDGWKGNKAAGGRMVIYNNDQIFLRDCVWPLVKGDCLQHDFCCRDTFREAEPFPAKLGEWRFCGERFGPDEKPESYSWEKRIDWMQV